MDRTKIASGRHAEVFACENNMVMKLYPKGTERSEVLRELENTKLVKEYGLESAVAFEFVEEDERYGFLMNHIHGPIYYEWMLQHPTAIGKLISLFVHEHHEMHLHKVPELPSVKDTLRRKIGSVPDLSKQARTKVLQQLERLPDGDNLCHMDYHPENIVASIDGPVIVDWADASRGNLMADVAMTALLFEMGTVPTTFSRDYGALLDNTRDRFFNSYVFEYMKYSGKGEDELIAWRLPVAAARLAEGIPDERDKLLRIIDSGL